MWDARTILLLLIVILTVVLALLLAVNMSLSAFTYINKDMKSTSGAGEYTSDEVIKTLQPYLKETGSSHIEEYLIDQMKYKSSKIKSLKNLVDKKEKYGFLKTLIEEIWEEKKISTVDEFIEKMHITYVRFVPDDKQKFLVNAFRVAKPSSKDVSKITNILDDFLSAGTLTYSKINKKAKKFLEFNTLYKFKSNYANKNLSKIKTSTLPASAYEVDYIGLRPMLQSYAKDISGDKSYKKLIKQIKHDIEKLKLSKYYPEFYLTDVATVGELAKSLSDAVDRALGKSRIKTRTWLEQLEREKAEMRARDERKKREEAEKREREERGKRESAEKREREERERRERIERESAEDKERERREREETERIKEREEAERRDREDKGKEEEPPPPEGVEGISREEIEQIKEAIEAAEGRKVTDEEISRLAKQYKERQGSKEGGAGNFKEMIQYIKKKMEDKKKKPNKINVEGLMHSKNKKEKHKKIKGGREDNIPINNFCFAPFDMID